MPTLGDSMELQGTLETLSTARKAVLEAMGYSYTVYMAGQYGLMNCSYGQVWQVGVPYEFPIRYLHGSLEPHARFIRSFSDGKRASCDSHKVQEASLKSLDEVLKVR